MKQLLCRLIEPKKQIPLSSQTFSTKQILSLVFPLIIAQILQLIVGIVDTMVSSQAGINTVAGVSLVSTINSIFIFIFTSIALAGSVIISQYLGNKNKDKACISACQTYLVCFFFSLICTIILLKTGDFILEKLYFKTEKAVLDEAKLYFKIAIFSFPGNALYNAGAALLKSINKTKTTMKISLIINFINIIGDLIGVLVLKLGVKGVAIPTVISWYIAALLSFVTALNKKEEAFITLKGLLKLNPALVKKILTVSIPNTFENSLFHIARIVLASLIATFGTAQLTANGIGQTIWTLSATVNIALAPAFINIIGKASGAKDFEACDYYFIKLTKITVLLSILWNIFLTALLPLYIKLYAVTDDIKNLVILTTIIHNFFTGFLSPIAQTSPEGFRATSCIKFPFLSSVFCTCIIRVSATFLLALGLNLGLTGYVIAMAIDWAVKSILVTIYYKKGTWKYGNFID